MTGRVIFLRSTGKLCFATLREGAGADIQAMLSLASVGEAALEDWKSLVDIGDHVSVERRGRSPAGAASCRVLAARWDMAAKALRPLPVAHQARCRRRPGSGSATST